MVFIANLTQWKNLLPTQVTPATIIQSVFKTLKVKDSKFTQILDLYSPKNYRNWIPESQSVVVTARLQAIQKLF